MKLNKLKNLPSDYLIIALSGGPDSVALLHVLKEEGFEKLVIAHVDHQIREKSHEDAEFCRKLAEEYSLPFELKTLSLPDLAEQEKDNLEALARRERYAFFRELKEKHGAQLIVTAHHADDQMETILMNMLRGCGVEGLAGMKETDGDIWRPLLPYSKQEIEEYCGSHQLEYVKDVTNEDLSYRRNYLRHQVIPHLKQLNPNFLGTMQKNVKLWAAAAEHFQREAQRLAKEVQMEDHRYDLHKFLALDETLQAFVLREIFAEVHGHKQNLAQDHLEQVLKVLRTNVSGKQKEFGNGKVLARKKECFEVVEV